MNDSRERRSPRLRRWAGLLASAVIAATLQAAVLPQAAQAADPAPYEPVTGDVLPAPQTNGIIFSIAVVGNVAYAGGNFTKARPAGTALGGPEEVNRTNLLAFDITTGALLPFAPVITGSTFTSTTNPGPFCDSLGSNNWVCDAVFRVERSPDGSKIFIGGDFTNVNGQGRFRLAAFSTATGDLDTAFKPAASSRVRGLAVTATTVYFGGSFTSVGGVARNRVAATTYTSTLLPLNPSVDREVWAVALSQTGDRLFLGGQFDFVNGAQQHGMAAIDTATSASLLFPAATVIPGAPGATSNRSWVTDFHVVGNTIYVANDGEGSGIFDGRFSADVTTGQLLWIDRCLGATQSITVLAGLVYSASHAHDCTSVVSFPERNPRYYQRLVAETVNATSNNPLTGEPIPSIVAPWNTTDGGPTTSYWKNGPWAVEAAGDYLVVGGEFLTINGVNQASLAVMTLRSKAPKKYGPITPFPNPVVRAQTAGALRVSWRATYDREHSRISYQVLRNDVVDPVAVIDADSTFWDMPELSFTDTTVTPGVAYRYRVRAVDPDGNAVGSPQSDPVTALASPAVGRYVAGVAADGARHLFTFDEPTGPVKDILSTIAPIDLPGGVTLNQPGPAGLPGTAARFNGSSSNALVLKPGQQAPNTFSVELWMKYAATTGGTMVNFGNNPSGSSGSHDRKLYVSNDGRINFGVYPPPGATKAITSPARYNDNQWHHVVGTLGSNGMVLYVDGVQVAADPTVTQGQLMEGYWRIGGDTISGWPNASSSGYINGFLDQVAIYPNVLTAAQVADHYARRANRAPTASFTTTCTGRTCAVDASASADPDGSIVSYSWNFGDGSTATGKTASRTYTASTPQTITLTVTDNEGATAQTTRQVAPANAVPTAVANVTCTALTCAFDSTGSADTDGTIASYAWDFGDGTTGTGASTTKTYATSGSYTVTLTVTDNEGGVGTTTKVVTPANQSPTAAFWVTCTSLTCAVDGTASTDPDGTIASYAWDFGDTTTGTGATASVKYAAPGTYTIKLTVTDNNGATSFVTKDVTVANAKPLPVATVSCNGLTCAVDGTGSSDPDGTIAGYSWDFGDGSPLVTDASTTKTYATAGTYTIKLTVTDAEGASDSTTKDVTVAVTPPSASFTATCTLLTCTVDASASTAASPATLTGYAWDFGDGTTATGPTAVKTYAAGANRTISLVVTDSLAQTATTTRAVTPTARIAKDTFARTLSSGFGSADLGGTWSQEFAATNYSVTGGKGVMNLPSGGTRSTWLGGVSATDTDSTVKVSVAALPQGTNAAVWAYVIGRRPNDTVSYRLRLRVFPDGSVRQAIVRRNGGTDTAIGSETVVSGLTVAAGDEISARLVVSGTAPTTLQSRVWKSTATQPSTWATNTTDATAELQVAGAVGLGSYNPSANTASPTAARFSGYTVSLPNTPAEDNLPPVAAYTVNCVSLACTFDASGSSDPDDGIASYAWTFGDGRTGTGRTTTLAYAAAGTYSVTLTVTDPSGASTPITQDVVVTKSATLGKDTFERTGTNGWGTAEVGGPWSVLYTASNYAVTPDGATMTVPAGATRNAWLSSIASTATEVDVDFKVSALPSAGTSGIFAYIGARRVDENLNYRARVRIMPDGSVRLANVKRESSGTDVLIGSEVTVPGLTVTTGTWLRLRAVAAGTSPTTVRAKVWDRTTTEPASWQVQGTDSASALQIPAGIGLTAYTASTNTATPLTVSFDNFSATELS
ncbi:MAG: PKD domain-containing protein [Kineosporiaceae bacterium]